MIWDIMFDSAAAVDLSEMSLQFVTEAARGEPKRWARRHMA